MDALRGGITINRAVGTAPSTLIATVRDADGDGTLPTLSLGGLPARFESPRMDEDFSTRISVMTVLFSKRIAVEDESLPV